MTSRAERVSASTDRQEAFAALADRHLEAAYRLAGVILGDPFEAEDATHDAVVTSWRGYAKLRDPDRFEAWVQRILVNTCRDRLRRRGRRQASPRSTSLGWLPVVVIRSRTWTIGWRSMLPSRR